MIITEEEINAVVERIVKGYNPEKIILFGSYSAGNPNENSDIDLFIVKNTDKPRPERAVELRKMLYGAKLPIDLIVYNQKEIDETRKNKYSFVNNVLESGKVMYERGSWGEIMKRDIRLIREILLKAEKWLRSSIINIG